MSAFAVTQDTANDTRPSERLAARPTLRPAHQAEQADMLAGMQRLALTVAIIALAVTGLLLTTATLGASPILDGAEVLMVP